MNLSTGIAELDRLFSEIGRADEGLPAGSIVAIQAPPAAQVDSLLVAGIDQRPTHYFTTTRSKDAVRAAFERAAGDPAIDRIEGVDGSDAATQITDALADLETGEDVVVDAVDVVEAETGTSEYLAFLDRLAARLRETDSIALLYGIDDDAAPANRRYTLEVADFVWNIRPTPATGSQKLEYYLSIPKARGIDLDEDDRMLKIDVGRDFIVDKSRNI